MWRVIFEALATARKNSSASSVSKPAIEVTGSSASKTQSGRPEMSIAHSASDSSIGTEAEPAVTGEQVEHVVEETNPGAGARLGAAVEVQRKLDLGLRGAPLSFRCA